MGKIILGVDPGYGRVGLGIIESEGSRSRSLHYSCIETPKELDFNQRLFQISRELDAVIKEFKPDVAVIEKLYFAKNTTTAIDVGQARGVILLTLFNNNVPSYELTPLQVKQYTSGYGKASKKQMQEVVKLLLGLSEIPKPDDAADALALALTWLAAGKYLELTK